MKNINASFPRTFLWLQLFCAIVVAQTNVAVSSLAELKAAMLGSNQAITMKAGNYELTALASGSRVLTLSGSNNILNLQGVKINVLVGSIHETWFVVTGSNNTVRGGEIEDYYANGLKEITDFSAYNNDRKNLAYGLGGAAVVTIHGNRNRIVGLKLTTRGSFPFGYGSQYGIGAVNTFGLDKRCGILITGKQGVGFGVGNILDSIQLYHLAFGHGIYMQEGADSTTIRNSYVEGRMRLSDDMYNDNKSYDLPNRTNFLFPADDAISWKESAIPWSSSYPIPRDVMYPLAEDGIRMYDNTGSITVENCTVKQMRGGIRLYLGGKAIVRNSTAIDCGATNWNLSADAVVTSGVANFAYAPISDFRLSRSRQSLDLTILPSPHAVGPHNMADILGGSHNIVFRRTPGPLDSTTRPMIVYGNSSTIDNQTEYPLVLETGTSGNKVTSCGPVTDKGANVVTKRTCVFDLGCGSPQSFVVADSFKAQSGKFQIAFTVATTGDNNNGVVGLAGKASAGAFSDMAALVQFDVDSTLKVRNGAVYEALAKVRWKPSSSYRFVFVVDKAQALYEARVVIGSDTSVLGRNLAFRTDWGVTPSLDRIVVKTTACPLNVSGMVLKEISTPTQVARSEGLHSSQFTKVEYFTPTGERVDQDAKGLLVVKSSLPGGAQIRTRLVFRQ